MIFCSFICSTFLIANSQESNPTDTVDLSTNSDIDQKKLKLKSFDYKNIFFWQFGVIQQMDPINPKTPKREGGAPGPTFGISYLHQSGWTLSMNLKASEMIENDIENRKIFIMSLSQSNYYSFRVHHPMYLILGYELGFSYLLQKVSLPLQQHPNYKAAVTTGVLIGLVWRLNDQLHTSIQLIRWRTVDSQGIHAFSGAMNLSFKM